MKGYITTQILKEFDTDIKLDIATPVDPKEFFQTGDGLYVWSDFNERVLGKAKQLKGPQEYRLEILDLVQDASDAQIEESIGKKNIFKDSDVCAVVAELISKQPKGKKGVLLNNGYSNLFYTPRCVVYVRWSSVSGDWYVYAWQRGGSRWNAGRRVFSPQLTLKTSK